MLDVLPDQERQLLEIEIAHGQYQDPFYAIKQKVVGTAHRLQDGGRRLQVLGFLRVGQRRPTQNQYDLAVDKAARARVELKQHSDAWTPTGADLRLLMPLVAKIIQNGSAEEASDMLGNVQDSVLSDGLRRLSQGGNRDDFEKALNNAVQRELTRVAKHTEAIFEGLLAIYDGEEPRKVAEILGAG